MKLRLHSGVDNKQISIIFYYCNLEQMTQEDLSKDQKEEREQVTDICRQNLPSREHCMSKGPEVSVESGRRGRHNIGDIIGAKPHQVTQSLRGQRTLDFIQR